MNLLTDPAVKVSLSDRPIRKINASMFNLQTKTCDFTYSRCDFEHGICEDWTNEIEDDFDWTLRQGMTRTVGTGPSSDHTTRTPSGKTGLHSFILSKASCGH